MASPAHKLLPWNHAAEEVAAITRGLSLQGGRFHHAGKTTRPDFFRYAHPLFRFITVTAGAFRYTISDHDQIADIELTPGDVLFCSRQGVTKPGDPRDQSGCRMYTVSFFPSFIRFLLTETAYDEDGLFFLRHCWHHTHTPMDGPGWNVVMALDELCHAPEREDALLPLADFLFRHCCWLLSRDKSAVVGKAFRTYQFIHAYITENFNTPITRETVAEQLHLTPSHVSKLFKRFSRLSFNETLRETRMKRALELLREDCWSIKEIADQCGFTRVGYFIETFKAHYGTSPGAFHASSKA